MATANGDYQMAQFILRRFGVMILTALVLTFIVFLLTNLYPNLEKVAKFEGNVRMTDEQVESWLTKNGYTQPVLKRYGEWLGVMPGWTRTENGITTGRCVDDPETAADAPTFCGVLQGDWGHSTVFKDEVGPIISERLGLTGKLMFWVMLAVETNAFYPI